MLESQSRSRTKDALMDGLNQTLSLRSELRKLLETLKDQGTEIENGFGAGEGDFYVTVQGHEFRITVAPG
jgi:hypothetical protein